MGSATQALAFKFFAESTTEEDEETGEDEGDQIQPNGGPNQSELGFGRCSEQVVAVNQGLKHEEHDYRRGSRHGIEEEGEEGSDYYHHRHHHQRLHHEKEEKRTLIGILTHRRPGMRVGRGK